MTIQEKLQEIYLLEKECSRLLQQIANNRAEIKRLSEEAFNSLKDPISPEDTFKVMDGVAATWENCDEPESLTFSTLWG
jgi:predicted nuclease with TOPRIM domain